MGLLGTMSLHLSGQVSKSILERNRRTHTVKGTYFQADDSTYDSDPVGIAWVTFDSTSGAKGSPTPRIFVGVVDEGQSVFKSEDGGATCKHRLSFFVYFEN